MGKHKKQQKHRAEKRRQEKRGKRNARKAAPRRLDDERHHAASVRLPSIDPPEPERCFAAVHVDSAGAVVPDPRVELGVAVGAGEGEVLDAWRARIRERPPERDPEGARRLQEARARLLEPERAIERELGVLHVPDPVALGLVEAPSSGGLPALDRLIGQLALYALLEDGGREVLARSGPE